MMGLSSCSSVYFLYQAGRGQLKLLNRGRPIEEVVNDPRMSPELRELLKTVPAIKAFGEASGLKPTRNYREYVDLGEDAVVYVVTVSDELALNPRIFRFPIVGSFNYLGWFSKEDALEFAESYEKKGFDIDVRGASAYSTLGWFPDPLLSSMIPRQGGGLSITAHPELVNVFLHESVHATIYINNQSYFNESLASFVADVLTERYFRNLGKAGEQAYTAYLGQRKRSEEVRKRMATAYADLKKIYDSGLDPSEKLKEKKAYLSRLETELGFRRRITNATLIQFRTYDPRDHGFGALFKKTNEDVLVFLGLLSKLTEKDFEHPQMEELRGVLGKL
ncbi:MAG: aminopeptidase [Bdellovibrionales bacterium]|nr:aminopeptidase [Bdellovibrionales bacterium]